jgi:hypothetical protein
MTADPIERGVGISESAFAQFVPERPEIHGNRFSAGDRLAFAEIELCDRDGAFRAQHFEPRRMTLDPVADRSGSRRMCQFIENCGRNNNTRV